LRRDAFEKAVLAHGLPVLPVLTGDWSVSSGYECGKLIDSQSTAVFCANDQMALGLIHALVSQGRDVPNDVSVIGFDDIPEAAHSLPPLTTVHQDFEVVGRRAVAQILAQIRDEPIESLPASTPWLVVRESVVRR
jgi:DNA-binding LacI/PurR family transcriptional regulator